MSTVIPKVIPKVFRKAALGQAEALMHGGFTLPGAIHTSGIYPSSRLSESYVGQCWTPDQGGVYRVAGSGYGQVRGAKLATTVAEGAILGPELVTNGGFDSDITTWAVVQSLPTRGAVSWQSGGFVRIAGDGTHYPNISKGILGVGKTYKVTFDVLPSTNILAGTWRVQLGSTLITNSTLGNSPGAKALTAICTSSIDFTILSYCNGNLDIDNISIREVIPVWIAPDTYPTRSIRTRFGTARVPTGTSVGMVSSPAFTNKVTCRKTNPTGTTNVVVGSGTVTVSVVDKTAELTASGLINVCSLGDMYRFQFTTDGVITFGGTVTNTNKHSIRAAVLGSGGTLRINDTGGVTWTAKTGVEFVSALDLTPESTLKQLNLVASAGADIYLILPELVESSYLPADPIVPLTAAADTAAAFTRAAVYMEEDTAGVFPTVTEVAREYMQNNCFATLGAGGADVFAGWTEAVAGSSTVTQELVDLPAGFTSACKLTTDGSAGACSVQQNPTCPIAAGATPIISFYVKSNAGNGLKFTVAITNGVTPLYLSGDGNTWGAAGTEWSPTDLPTTWSKYTKILPAIPNGYTSVNFIQVTRAAGLSVSKYITGISIGDTGIQNPYSSAASLMSDGSVVPVVAGASWAQNFAVFGTCVPDAGGQGNIDILSSRIDNANYIDIRTSSTGVFKRLQKLIASSGQLADVAYTHAANAPFDYLTIQTIHGMAIRVRPHATMTWSAWATNVTVNGKKPSPIGTKYQIGALNGGNGIAGKHPKVSIFELGNQASLTAYQDRAMLLAGRITG